MTPNIKRKSNIRFGGKQENKSCFTISQNISSQKPNLKNSPFGQNKKKIKKQPVNRLKLKVRIEGNLENKSSSAL